MFDEWIGKSLAAGTYRIRRVIGRGGMGVVFEAEHLGLGRTVALKMLLNTDASALTRFRAEAQALARLDHPNIVAVTDFRTPSGGEPAFLVMAYLEGQTLAQILTRGPLTVPRSVEIACGILDALIAAHAVGVVHRDLKPSNVFLVASRDAPGLEEVKLVDFGIAKVDGAQLTTTGAVLGTPAYMAPEQVTGAEGGVDQRSDLYAVGVLLFEMLTGQRPFVGTAAVSIFQAIIQNPTPLVHVARPDVPREISAVISAAMSKSKSRRLGSAVQMRELLTQSVVTGTSRPSMLGPSGSSSTPLNSPLDTQASTLGAALPNAQLPPSQDLGGSSTSPPNHAALLAIVGAIVLASGLVVVGVVIAWQVLSVRNGAPAPATTEVPDATPLSSTAVSTGPPTIMTTPVDAGSSASTSRQPKPAPKPTPTPSAPVSTMKCLCVPTDRRGTASLCPQNAVTTPTCRCGELGPPLSWVRCHEPDVPCQRDKPFPPTAKSGDRCQAYILVSSAGSDNDQSAELVDATLDCQRCGRFPGVMRQYPATPGAPCRGVRESDGVSVEGVILCD